MQATTCLNCENELHATHGFCPHCGQKSNLHRLSLHDVGHDAMHYFTHADKGIFSLLKQLAIAPGKVAREFVNGKRKKYFPPVNFFFLVAAICALMTGVVAPMLRSQATGGQATHQVSPASASKVSPEKQARWAKAGKFMSKYSNLLAMLATPLITLLVWLFYFKARYNFTEHLIANMYISGFTLLFYAIIIYPLVVVLQLKGFNFLFIINLLFEIVYRTITYYNFIHKKTPGGMVKAVLVSLAVVFFWYMLTGTLMQMYVRGIIG